jgi:nucleoside phosphorylase/quercetin dioxygenase-like cupin family protein
MKVDIGILTVLPDCELPAVQRAFGIDIAKTPDMIESGMRFWECKLHNRILKRDIDIVISAIGESGNPSASAATTTLIDLFDPRLVCLVGIAAGVEVITKFGDVVIPTYVLGYDKEKLLPEGPDTRSIWQTIRHPVSQDVTFFDGSSYMALLNDKILDQRGRLSENKLPPKDADIKEWSIIKGIVIASGEKIFGDGSLDSFRGKFNNNKIIAGDMESLGFAISAAQKECLWLIMRGISDHGNPISKDGRYKDRFHNIASINAAEVIHLFLETAYTEQNQTRLINKGDKLIEHNYSVCKISERKPVKGSKTSHISSESVTYFSLIPNQNILNSLDASIIEIDKIAKDQPLLHFHVGEEFNFLLNGELLAEIIDFKRPNNTCSTFRLTSEIDKLKRYDHYNSIWLKSNVPHGFRNLSDKTKMLAVYYKRDSFEESYYLSNFGTNKILDFNADNQSLENIKSGFGRNLLLWMDRQKKSIYKLSSQTGILEKDVVNWLNAKGDMPTKEQLDRIQTALNIKFPLIELTPEKCSVAKSSSILEWNFKRTDHHDPNQLCSVLDEYSPSEMQCIKMRFLYTQENDAKLAAHSGEEFIFVKEGKINFIYYDPNVLGLTLDTIRNIFKNNNLSYGKAKNIFHKYYGSEHHPYKCTLEEGDAVYLQSNNYHAFYNSEAQFCTVIAVHFDQLRKPKIMKI